MWEFESIYISFINKELDSFLIEVMVIVAACRMYGANSSILRSLEYFQPRKQQNNPPFSSEKSILRDLATLLN